MAAKTLLGEEEYLAMGFDNPEPDYVDGVLVERAMPNSSHSRVQRKILIALRPWDDAGTLISCIEIRLRVAAGRFRVADLAYFTAAPTAEIPTEPPYAVIEIVSPGDRHDEIVTKLDDYERAGLRFIFLADPPSRRLSLYREGSLLAVPFLEMPDFGVKIAAELLFT
jgi:Uma2 family endonuclease